MNNEEKIINKTEETISDPEHVRKIGELVRSLANHINDEISKYEDPFDRAWALSKVADICAKLAQNDYAEGMKSIDN